MNINKCKVSYIKSKKNCNYGNRLVYLKKSIFFNKD